MFQTANKINNTSTSSQSGQKDWPKDEVSKTVSGDSTYELSLKVNLFRHYKENIHSYI